VSASLQVTHELIATKLCLQVGKRRLINDVSLACKSGQWIQVIGANGVGKSTLLRMLAGLTDADDGSMTFKIDGQHIVHRSPNLLYQGHLHGFKDALTVIENLRLQVALDASGYQIDSKVDSKVDSKTNSILTDAIAAVGLTTRGNLAFGRLSAGQKRRCMLARLVFANQLLSSVKLCWILDEPLTALDSEAQQILGTLVAEHLSRGGSAILATHQNLTDLGLNEPITLDLSKLAVEVANIEELKR
jgi:heme exporter protein A